MTLVDSIAGRQDSIAGATFVTNNAFCGNHALLPSFVSAYATDSVNAFLQLLQGMFLCPIMGQPLLAVQALKVYLVTESTWCQPLT